MLSRVLERLLPRFEPPRELRPAGALTPGPGTLAIRWLGTAGHRLRFGGSSLLLDPFVSRPRVAGLLRKLRSDPRAIERWAPEASAVVVGHAHYDHLLDAPAIARRTGAALFGSESTARVALAQGVEAGRVSTVGSSVGPFAIDLVPSVHAKVVLGKTLLFPGVIARAREAMRVHEYRDGGALGVLVRAGDVTVYHNGSADLVDAALEGKRADVVLCGIAGWRYSAGYIARLVRILRPKVIVPTHYDAFFGPLEDGLRILPGIRFDNFLAEVARVAPGVKVVAPTPWEELLVARGGEDVAVVATSGTG